MNGMFTGVQLSTANYDGLLNGWSQLTLQSNVTLDAGYSQYSENAQISRAKIINDFGWTIHDKGPKGACISIAALKERINNNIDVTDVNTSCITDMSYLFRSKSNFNQDISGWDTSNVTTMNYMFQSATSFNQDISRWDVSNVTNMSYMFQNATSFDQNLGTWDVSNVTNMSNMFTNIELSTENYDGLLNGWSQLPLKSNVTLDAGYSQYSVNAQTARAKIISDFGWTINDGGLKGECISIAALKERINNNIDVTNINISCITDMSYLFYYKSNFIKILVDGMFQM
jgi:surface protein